MATKVRLQFMVDPDELNRLAYVPEAIRVKIIDAEAIFLLGILGESGRELVKAGLAFYFEGKLAKKLINKGIAEPAPLAESAKPCDHVSLLNTLLRPISYLRLSARATSILQEVLYLQYIGELVRQKEAYLCELRGFGPVTLKEVKDALTRVGLHLEFKLDEVLPTFERHLARRKRETRAKLILSAGAPMREEKEHVDATKPD